MVPLPLEESGAPLPIESVLAAARREGSIGTIPALDFRHAFAQLDLESVAPQHAAQVALDCYSALLEATGLKAIEANGELLQSAPYNLLFTRRWMLLVPRSGECVEGISVNALGFVGSLFVRDAAQMQVIKRLGPMTVLQRAAVPSAMPGLPHTSGDDEAI
jgi:ATP adenylyltransferase